MPTTTTPASSATEVRTTPEQGPTGPGTARTGTTEPGTTGPAAVPRLSAGPRRPGPGSYPRAAARPRVRRIVVGAPSRRRPLDDDLDGAPDGARGAEAERTADVVAGARPVRPAEATPLPDPTAQCCSVVRAAVEVLRGERPAGHLARWVTPQVRDQLAERARLVREAASTTGMPPTPRSGNGTTSRATTRAGESAGETNTPHERRGTTGHRPVLVRRVRLVRLGDDIAEATVILDDEGRVRAAAVRLEARRGTWRVAVLEIG